MNREISVTIGTANAQRGQKVTGYLKIPHVSSTIDIPVGIINGDRPGPTLALTAGVHACEYAAIVAASHIFRIIQPSQLSGQILLCFMVNPPAFITGTPFVNPLDDVNPNRIFPGKVDGSITYRMVDAVFREVISKATYYIDLHGGDLTELIPPHVIITKTGKDGIDSRSESLGRAYGTRDMMILNPEKSGEDKGQKSVGYTPPKLGMSLFAAAGSGIPSITAEAGRGLGSCYQSEIQVHVDGITNAMRVLNMLDGKSTVRDSQRMFSRGFTTVTVSKSGVFHPTVEPGDDIVKDQIIGEVTDIFGEIIENVRSPVDGTIWIIRLKVSVDLGDSVFSIWLSG
jgi:uncharacterized protein